MTKGLGKYGRYSVNSINRIREAKVLSLLFQYVTDYYTSARIRLLVINNQQNYYYYWLTMVQR